MEKISEFEEKVLSEKQIFSGKVIDVVKQEVKLPNGKIAAREIVRHNGAVGIVVILNDKIGLVRQWRSPMQQETLEIPAGKINSDEKLSELNEVAARELREETGIIAKSMEKISEFFGSPGYSNEKLYLFNAIEPKKEYSDLLLDDDEFLNVEWKSLVEVKQDIIQGTICDAKTLLAINYWELKLLKGE